MRPLHGREERHPDRTEEGTRARALRRHFAVILGEHAPDAMSVVAHDELAARDDWPPLYHPARLAASTVPAAAAVYFEDMYVPTELSLPTARAIRGLRPWVTNEYQHDGLRVSGGPVLGRLIALARGAA